jgi:integrase
MARKKGKNLQEIVNLYYASLDYRSLTPITQRDYRYCINALLGIQHGRIKFANANLATIKPPNAQYAYNLWAEKGVPWANHCQAVASKLWNWAISLGHTEVNPFSKVSRRPHKPRRVVWSREDVTLFLETAYSRFQWRSVGLIVQMAYEWCQRLGDMANLTWDKYDFNSRVLKLEQSKRRARVELPTSDELHEMLMKQHQDLGHQPYVCPMVYFNTLIVEKPYNKYTLQHAARTIMDAAGLPKEYQIMDMRRTGTVEMVDAGVPLAQIMSVTGHQSPQSVTPYLKNTLTSASSALSKRNEFKFDSSVNP